MQGVEIPDFGEARQVGTTIKKYSEEFGSLLTEINGLNNQLKSAWEGDDEMTYSNKIEEQEKVMRQLQEKINNTGIFLENASDSYQQNVQDNKSAIH